MSYFKKFFNEVKNNSKNTGSGRRRVIPKSYMPSVEGPALISDDEQKSAVEKEEFGKINNKQTPLHLTAQDGDVDYVGSLLDRGENINARDSNGQTPLHFAAKNGMINAVGILLGRGADPRARDKDRQTPLHLAKVNQHSLVGGLILEYIAQKNSKIAAGEVSSFDVPSNNLREQAAKQIASCHTPNCWFR